MAGAGRREAVGWILTDHACRFCLGRLLRRIDHSTTALVEHRCAECGQSVLGDVVELCWCGVAVKGHGHAFECFRNGDVTTATPQEILVRERRAGVR